MTYFKHFFHQVEDLLILASVLFLVSVLMIVSVNIISAI